MSDLPRLSRPAVAAVSVLFAVCLVVSGLPHLSRPAVAAVSVLFAVCLVVSDLPRLCRPALGVVVVSASGLQRFRRPAAAGS